MSKPQRPTPKRNKPNPYLGFGWVGWVGFVILGALSIAVYHDWDPLKWVFQLLLDYQTSIDLERVADDIELVHWYLADGPIRITLFTVLPLIAILIWFPTTLDRRAVGVGGLLVAAGLSPIFFHLLRMGRFPDPFGNVLLIGVIYSSDWIIARLIIAGITVASVFVVARSWLLVGALTALILLAWLTFYTNWPLFSPTLIGDTHFMLVWNAGIAVVVLLRAILHHLHPPPPGKSGRCPTCDYDLTNLPSKTCPECGEDVSAVVSPET